MDIEAKLDNARSLLNELGNAVSDLVGVAPEVFEDEKLQQDLADFRQSYDQAVLDLANPSLRIAMIGTTSSGKSTIVVIAQPSGQKGWGDVRARVST